MYYRFVLQFVLQFVPQLESELVVQEDREEERGLGETGRRSSGNCRFVVAFDTNSDMRGQRFLPLCVGIPLVFPWVFIANCHLCENSLHNRSNLPLRGFYFLILPQGGDGTWGRNKLLYLFIFLPLHVIQLVIWAQVRPQVSV